MCHFVGRHKLGCHLIDVQLACHLLSHVVAVAGEHHGLLHAHGFELRDGCSSIGLQLIGDDDVPHVNALYSHMNYGAREMAGAPMSAHAVHEFGVAHAHQLAVDPRADALPSYLFGLLHRATISLVAKGLAQRLGNGMGRKALHMGGEMEQFVLAEIRRMHCCYAEYAPRERASLIEHHGCGLSQRIDVVASFDKDALPRGATDTAEEGEWNGEHQRAGT